MLSDCENPILPLENLPEKSIPPRRTYTAYFLNINSETQELLDKCDWNLYEKTVAIGLQEARKRYKKSPEKMEAISQISIVTDPQRQITEISLESGPISEGLKSDPNGFQYPNYYTILHRELRPLANIDYTDSENEKAAKVWIETSLLKVLERVQHSDYSAGLHQESGVWLGISSPHSRYDHVTQV